MRNIRCDFGGDVAKPNAVLVRKKFAQLKYFCDEMSLHVNDCELLFGRHLVDRTVFTPRAYLLFRRM